MHMLVGITGNLGSGKTEFRRALERFGHRTHDADRMVEQLYKDTQVLGQLQAAFGEEVVKKGAVDRKVLAAKVFNSSLNLKKLNNIIHPLVRGRISKIQHFDGIVFVEVPLLFEARMQDLFDKVVLLRASHSTSKSRAKKKGLPEEEFEKRVASQYAADRIEAMADFVVDAECTPSQLAEKAGKIIERLKAGA